jgi:opacity protein-like surface antigen
MNGYNLYVERSFGVARFGVGLNQRGGKLNQAVSDMGVTVSVDGEQTLNYLTLHAIYPYEIQEKITVFGGIQLGNGIGGEVKIKQVISGSGFFDGTSVDTEDIDAEDMDLEYGLFLGGDYMINEKIGIRASYFKALSDIVEDAKTKNNTLSVSLLYHL